MNNSLVLREEQTLIEKNFTGFIDYETLYLNEDYEITDTFLNEVVENLIASKEYNNIFIPLCFGPIMSDFNGLRLATHIRCTPGINQNKNIYIFSFVDISYLINHECFDILKTKGVKLIKYSFHTIQTLIDNNFASLAFNEIPNEVKKINLQIPANYEDNHSIANEWAIYRWSQTIDANYDDYGIKNIIDIQNNNLYFKYLKTIFPISHLDKLDSENLKINFEGQTNILYIDDEADKGWREIFETIFLDKNKNIDFSCLDNELNEKTKDEICDLALQTIKDDNIDLVILDFRLHKDDFENNTIEEVTGYKILKKIKEYNKGIQVIIFSATNKIWNLQALQAIGADGFIIKESPENSIDPEFTKQSIRNFIDQLNNSFNLIFLRKLVIKCNKVLNGLNNDEVLHKLIESYFEISINLLIQINDDKRFFNFAYLQLFQIIESLVSLEKHFIDSDDAYVIIDDVKVCVQKKSLDKAEWPISFESSGKYILKNKEQTLGKNNYLKRLDTNFKVSSTLIFKFGNANSSVLKWTNIYTNRNTKAAHYNSKNEITKNDIEELLCFIEYFSNKENINLKNTDKGLKEKTFEESREIFLKNSGNYKISNQKK